MPKDPKHFVVSDPATFDGNPYEVAERAMKQSGAVASVLDWTLDVAHNMLRSAEMERQIHETGHADAGAWDESAQARLLAKLREEAQKIEKMCATLEKAASFDPKHPPKE